MSDLTTILIGVGLVWLGTGIAAIWLALSDQFGRKAYRVNPVLLTLAFVVIGPIGLGMVLGMRAAFRSFDKRHGSGAILP